MYDPEATAEEMREIRDRENMERLIYNLNRISQANLRATDFSSNKDIVTPGPVDLKSEIRIQQQKDNHMNAVNKYVVSRCDRKGEIIQSENMTEKRLKDRNR